jgi:hypothetical protein
MSATAAPQATPSDKRKAAAADKRRATIAERKRIAEQQERDADIAKRTAARLAARTEFVKRARTEAARVLAEAERDRDVALPVFERLVLGGAPQDLANAIRQQLCESSAAQRLHFTGTGSLSRHNEYNVDGVRALLEAEGFTDIQWHVTLAEPPLHWSVPTFHTWRCSFTAQL